jgi:hypothetical protein
MAMKVKAKVEKVAAVKAANMVKIAAVKAARAMIKLPIGSNDKIITG